MKKYRFLVVGANPPVTDIVEHEAKPLSKLRALTHKVEALQAKAEANGGTVRVYIDEA